MKQVCHTNVALPSQSLLKNICYPEAYKFTTKATQWGYSHESTAREQYVAIIKDDHLDLCVRESGLVINPEWPHIGATPDGIVHCTCCGKGLLEVKRPYCHCKDTVRTVSADPKSCLIEIDESIMLDKSHTYYYQVQTQIFVFSAD